MGWEDYLDVSGQNSEVNVFFLYVLPHATTGTLICRNVMKILDNTRKDFDMYACSMARRTCAVLGSGRRGNFPFSTARD